MRIAGPGFAHPVVLAPLGGGPGTPRLAAAVTRAGGLGFLPSGYRSAEATAREIRELRELTDGPFGVNVFVPSVAATPDREDLRAYATRVAEEARAIGAPVGAPTWDDDDWSDKIALLVDQPVPVVSFTFGCPASEVIRSLQQVGSAVWVTVTDASEARRAAAAGADALVAQGIEAGGHRGSFTDQDGQGEHRLLVLLRLVRAATNLPIIAAGGIADGRGIAAVLAAGADAASLGTAFMRCDEAGTSVPHLEAMALGRPTAVTRAFTGRRARGIVNRFLTDHPHAPSAYPEINNLTAPFRAHARAAGDAELINLWAGESYQRARSMPAGDLVALLVDELRSAS